MQYFDDMVNY